MNKIVIMEFYKAGSHITGKFEQETFFIEGFDSHFVTSEVCLHITLKKQTLFKVFLNDWL